MAQEVTDNVATARYGSVELLRFLAALSVVFVHIPTVGVGHFGVDIFFVISGFVMLLSTERSGENFFLKRAIRILPTYYIFTLGVFFLALALPSLLDNTSANFVHLLKSLLFVPFDKNGAGHYPILFLGWTLNYEMYFYALFAVALRFSIKNRAIITTVFLALIYSLCKGSDSLPLVAYSHPIVFEFVLGMVVYELVVMRRIKFALVMVLIIILAMSFDPAPLANRFFIFGIPSAFLLGLVILGIGSRQLPGFVYLLGGSSYALYLTHPYVIQVFEKIFGWFSMGPLFQAAAIVLSLILVNVVAITVYLVFELPVTQYLRRKYLGARVH